MSKQTKIIIICCIGLVVAAVLIFFATRKPGVTPSVASIEATGIAAAPAPKKSAEESPTPVPTQTIDDNFKSKIYPAILQFTQAPEYTDSAYKSIAAELDGLGVSIDGTAAATPFTSYYNAAAYMTDQAFGSVNISSSYAKRSDGSYTVTATVMRASSPTAGLAAAVIAANLRSQLPQAAASVYGTTVKWTLKVSKDRMTGTLKLNTPGWDKR